MRLLPLLALLLAVAPLSAQETRTSQPGTVSPPATLADMAFITGRWEGPGIEGAQATESWLPAANDTMVGTFVQTDSSGGIMFTEHMYLMQENGSLVLRLKHFGPDLAGWEAQADTVDFRLLAIEPCRADFSGLTMRCDGPDRLLIAVRMREEDGSTGELVFRFARAG